MKLRFLIYGAGVIGSIFAGRLAASGQNVTVLARGNRAKELRQSGVVLSMPGTNKDETAEVSVIEKLAPDDRYDYIFVVMQRTQVDDVLPILADNCSKNIVFVVNTCAGHDSWAQAVGSERLILGFPSAGGERVDGKVSYFIGKGVMRAFQTTTFGEYNGSKAERVRLLIEAFNAAGIPSVFCADMDAWQKTHVAVITSIANALYRFDCNNFRLAKSFRDIQLMVNGIKEGLTVLNKLGYKTTPSKLLYFRLPSWLVAGVFKIFMGTQLAEITMAKHCIAAKSEVSYLQTEFDELISRSGMQTPSIDSLRHNICI